MDIRNSFRYSRTHSSNSFIYMFKTWNFRNWSFFSISPSTGDSATNSFDEINNRFSDRRSHLIHAACNWRCNHSHFIWTLRFKTLENICIFKWKSFTFKISELKRISCLIRISMSLNRTSLFKFWWGKRRILRTYFNNFRHTIPF